MFDFKNETVSSPSELSDWAIQARLIFAAFVAGKSAGFAEKAIRRFLNEDELPFDTVNRLHAEHVLFQRLKEARVGNYHKHFICLRELVKLNLRTCTLAELESIHGVGPKTARFFVLWTGRDIPCAALYVHILKFLRGLGHKAPKNTPPAGKTYARLEQAFLVEAHRRNMTPNALDFLVWESYSTNTQLPS